ncbi:hypothetical protein [Polaromonas aquatica]|uniref:hypothetical protein n=1 Tax=Polaromonas aquatica TaxID=332657 RepID=UPI003D659FD0
MASRRYTADQTAKDRLGPAPSNYGPIRGVKKVIGTHAQQSVYKKTPSKEPVEVDHMSPDSLHQAAGSSRKSGAGASLSKRLPASAMNKTQHRRKLTTGSGAVVEHHRAYLLHAHHGQIPFAGPMGATQDHYAAALEVEFRSTATPATLFGKPTIHDARPFDNPSQQGVVPKKDAEWGMDRQLEMLTRIRSTAHIDATHESHLKDVVTEQRAGLADMYKQAGK